MKRPMLLIGFAACAAAAVWNLLWRPELDDAKNRAAEELCGLSEEAGGITAEGIVQECVRTESGLRISLGRVSAWAEILPHDAAEGTSAAHQVGTSSGIISEGTSAAYQGGTSSGIISEGTSAAYQEGISGGVSEGISLAFRKGNSGGNPVLNQYSGMGWDERMMVPEEYQILIRLRGDSTGGGLDRLGPGCRVRLSGEAEAFERASNPGQFDARGYYFSRDIICELKDAELLQIQSGRGGLRALLFRVQRRLGEAYEKILDRGEAHTASAISLGEKAVLDTDVKALYQESGIAHILSVSGLHTSLVGMGVYRLLRRCLLGIPGAAVLSALAMLLYVGMTGCGVSAVRALLMFLIWLLAQVLGRKYDLKSAVSAAAAVLLATEPRYLLDSSFLLSFAAILTIAFLLPELQRCFPGNAAVAGIGLWLGMLPVTLWFFYQTPPWSMLVNLVVIPLMPLVMGFGLLGAAASLVSEGLGTFLAAPVHYLLTFFELLCRVELRFPGAVQVLGRPEPVAVVLYYTFLGAAAAAGRISDKNSGIRMEAREMFCRTGRTPGRKGRKARACEGQVRLPFRIHISEKWAVRAVWLGCAALGLMLLRNAPPRELEITVLDVGQGDGTLLRMPDGTVCMIDGGSSTVSGLWEYRLGKAAAYFGESTIDYVFLSHADQDHISGIEEYLESYETGLFQHNLHGVTLKHLVLPPTAESEDFAELVGLAGEKGITVSRMAAGAFVSGDREEGSQMVERGGDAGTDGTEAQAVPMWRIFCLAPEAESLTGDRNEDSMVLMLQYGKFRMLFTGDLEGASERRLAQSLGRAGEDSGRTALDADVLKAGHHGSKNASTAEFLAAVSPKVSVISCAAQNRYGHPAEETLARLEACGSRIITTPAAGAVTIRTDGRTFTCGTCLGGET